MEEASASTKLAKQPGDGFVIVGILETIDEIQITREIITGQLDHVFLGTTQKLDLVEMIAPGIELFHVVGGVPVL